MSGTSAATSISTGAAGAVSSSGSSSESIRAPLLASPSSTGINPDFQARPRLTPMPNTITARIGVCRSHMSVIRDKKQIHTPAQRRVCRNLKRICFIGLSCSRICRTCQPEILWAFGHAYMCAVVSHVRAASLYVAVGKRRFPCYHMSN